jgi:hypothetical protein
MNFNFSFVLLKMLAAARAIGAFGQDPAKMNLL